MSEHSARHISLLSDYGKLTAEFVVVRDDRDRLQRELNEANRKVQFLQSAECEAAWCDRWKTICAERDAWKACAGALAEAMRATISGFNDRDLEELKQKHSFSAACEITCINVLNGKKALAAYEALAKE